MVRFSLATTGGPPGLCRGGSRSLTFPGVCPPAGASIVSRQAHERKDHDVDIPGSLDHSVSAVQGATWFAFSGGLPEPRWQPPESRIERLTIESPRLCRGTVTASTTAEAGGPVCWRARCSFLLLASPWSGYGRSSVSPTSHACGAPASSAPCLSMKIAVRFLGSGRQPPTVGSERSACMPTRHTRLVREASASLLVGKRPWVLAAEHSKLSITANPDECPLAPSLSSHGSIQTSTDASRNTSSSPDHAHSC